MSDRTANSDGLSSQTTFATLSALAFDDDLLFYVFSDFFLSIAFARLATLTREGLLLRTRRALVLDFIAAEVDFFPTEAEQRSARARGKNKDGNERRGKESEMFHLCAC